MPRWLGALTGGTIGLALGLALESVLMGVGLALVFGAAMTAAASRPSKTSDDDEERSP